jgi:hypothetical protein
VLAAPGAVLLGAVLGAVSACDIHRSAIRVKGGVL